eukprot:CAMPEP_0168338242 /NCGR_PEP_ID=MMETSP0213-20121227/12712_1 /TAXON_ID=151035 /ORGANISM="Euplotes harpa, Strain FSP1.4" /LENGTH=303 /DNA_ID=CAMNT_0008343971 /DNA_START=33 /DNA_END=944 /DNA_ORIENTATION=+
MSSETLSVTDLICLFESKAFQNSNDSKSGNAKPNQSVTQPKAACVIGDVDSDDEAPQENPFTKQVVTKFATKIATAQTHKPSVKVFTANSKQAKPEPVQKHGCIGDPSSSEEEPEKPQAAPESKTKSAVIIGGDEPVIRRFKVAEEPKPEKKTVIGDDSDDDKFTRAKRFKQTEDKSQPKKVVIGDVDDTSPDCKVKQMDSIKNVLPSAYDKDYMEKLSQLYEDKKKLNDNHLKRKEEKLKAYEEYAKNRSQKKMKDDTDSDNEKPQFDKEQLWDVFAHKKVDKPIMKGPRRKPQKKKDFELD